MDSAPVAWGILSDTPVGPLRLAWIPAGLVALSFDDGPLETTAGPIRTDPDPEAVPTLYVDLLTRYFAGEPVDPAGLPAVIAGTAFQERVWRALRTVSRGQVVTYGELAARAGHPRSSRAVGAAMGRNPVAIVVPCHRVVAAGDRLGGYSGGLSRKRTLLRIEGFATVGDRLRPGQLAIDYPRRRATKR
jgi:O-6-methylguanine DNA methyltransferase